MLFSIGAGILLALFISFSIAFLFTKSYQSKFEFLYWKHASDRKKAMSVFSKKHFVISSNIGSSLTLFVFFCGEMMVAFSQGLFTAVFMVFTLWVSYESLSLIISGTKFTPSSVNFNRFIGSRLDISNRNYYSSYSIFNLIGRTYGAGTALLAPFIIIIFVFLTLSSEVVFFHNIINSFLDASNNDSSYSGLFTFLFAFACITYVLRGGYEGIFRTDVFQLIVYVILVLYIFYYLFVVSDLSLNIFKEIYTHNNNLVFPKGKFLSVPLIFFGACVSFVFASIDLWNRLLIVMDSPPEICKTLSKTGRWSAILSIFPVTLGLYLRTYEPLVNKYLSIKAGFLTNMSFNDVTEMAFSMEFTNLFLNLPSTFLVLIWASITCLILTTFDSLLHLVSQILNQGAIYANSIGEEPLDKFSRYMFKLYSFFENKPRYVIMFFSSLVLAFSAILWDGPFAFTGLLGWNLIFIFAIIIVNLLVFKGTYTKKNQDSIHKLLITILGFWFLSFVLNSYQALIDSYSKSPVSQCIITLFVGIAFFLIMIRMDKEYD